LATDVEAVYKSLNKKENRAFIGETLQELGVFSYDIRLKLKAEDEYESALGKLRDNFKGSDIQIK
ncbi:MAG: hypothetical protein J1F39_04825, partial [Clostridiales bacterium]|nr:hypothetical protein [Clostridiales bacterium]